MIAGNGGETVGKRGETGDECVVTVQLRLKIQVAVI